VRLLQKNARISLRKAALEKKRKERTDAWELCAPPSPSLTVEFRATFSPYMGEGGGKAEAGGMRRALLRVSVVSEDDCWMLAISFPVFSRTNGGACDAGNWRPLSARGCFFCCFRRGEKNGNKMTVLSFCCF